MAEEVLQLVGLIGDEDSVVGFLLGGIGHQTITPPLQTVTSNVFVVDKETPADEIEDAFRTLVRRTDVGIVLITRLVADRIRHTLDIRERSNQVGKSWERELTQESREKDSPKVERKS